MTNREAEEQKIHEDIIILLETQYRREYPHVYLNPKNKKKAAVKSLDIYPDIIVSNKDNKIILIEEVETENTVTKEHASKQWREYAKGRYRFIIRVPYDMKEKALKILEELGIKAEIKGYRAAPSGYSIEY